MNDADLLFPLYLELTVNLYVFVSVHINSLSSASAETFKTIAQVPQASLTANCKFTVITDYNKNYVITINVSVTHRSHMFRIISILSETFTVDVDLNMEECMSDALNKERECFFCVPHLSSVIHWWDISLRGTTYKAVISRHATLNHCA